MGQDIGLPLGSIGLIPDLEYEALENKLFFGSVFGGSNSNDQRVFVLNGDVQDFNSFD
jgi:hypothetical protein